MLVPEAAVGMLGSVCDCDSEGLRRAGGEEVIWLSWSAGAVEISLRSLSEVGAGAHLT
jgi:hypothetical protein